MREFEKLNYYEVLEIPLNASSLEVRQAYEEAFSMYSEDSLVTYSLFVENEREEILRRIQEAFATLIDREKRAEYDRYLVDIGDADDMTGIKGDDSYEPSSGFQTNLTTAQTHLSQRIAKKTREKDVVDLLDAVLSKEMISGDDLRQIRRSFGIELEEIYQVTKVSLPVLQSIEGNQFANLPPEIYLRGFLKSYAETLQIDPKKTVEGYIKNARQKQGSAR